MKEEHNNYTFDLEIIGNTIKKLSNMVTPSMGAKGRMAVIGRGAADKPLITDDGVTIAKESRRAFTQEEMPIYTLCIEAMHNVEKMAFDGTTLTVLLTNEFYKYGEALLKKGLDNHVVSEKIQEFAQKMISYLNKNKQTEITPEIIETVASVSSKMPVIGKMIASAYVAAGGDMNVVIEHNRRRGDYQHEIVREEGFVLDMEGFYGDEFGVLTTDEKQTKTEFNNARLVLLSSGGLEQDYAKGFFNSIPKDKPIPPLVFFISRTFDPKSLQFIINTLVNTNKSLEKNGIQPVLFQFVMLEGGTADRRFLDIAAYSGGVIQDATLGTKAYLFEHCGYAKKIIIEKFKTIIVKPDELENRVAIDNRVQFYQEYLESRKFNIGEVDRVDIKKSIAALSTGIVKILIATPTKSEFELIKLKMDDAIGTVVKVCETGYIRGAGREIYNMIKQENLDKEEAEICRAPMKKILDNAGHKFKEKDLKDIEDLIYDVKQKCYTMYDDAGIYDSFEAYRQAITNASSIISQLILGYVYIHY